MTLEEKLTKIAEDMPKVYEAGKAEGISEGKQAEYDEFWNRLQKYGNRDHYVVAFAYGSSDGGWTDETYNPKYPIKGFNYGLQEVFRNNSAITDTKVPLRCMTNNLRTTFSHCTKLKRIPSLVLEAAVSNISAPFQNCTALEDLTIECVGDGCIAGNGFNVQWSTKLTHDSLMSIINALQDKSEDTSTTWTVTIGDANIAKLTDEELNIAYKKGWTVA